MVADLSLPSRAPLVNKLIYRGVEDRFDGNLADNYLIMESRVSLYCELNKTETPFDLYRIMVIFVLEKGEIRRIEILIILE